MEINYLFRWTVNAKDDCGAEQNRSNSQGRKRRNN